MAKTTARPKSHTSPSQVRAKRALGALLGVHAGDSLGASFEFAPWQRIKAQCPEGQREILGGGPFQWPAGHATDDTDLTRAVLLAYLKKARDCRVDLVVESAENMLRWEDGDWPDREPGSLPLDIGGATQIGLARYRNSRDPIMAGAGEGQAGNGSLMRCIPTALFQPDRQLRIKESMAISAITHNDSRCTVSCAAYNEMVAALLDGADPDVAIDVGLVVAHELDSRQVEAAITRGRELRPKDLADNGPRSLPGNATGYVLESLTFAVAALLDYRSLVDVLVDIVRVGGDTDTNAAIAGGLLGARDGVDALPENWVSKLQFGEEFTNSVRELLT